MRLTRITTQLLADFGSLVWLLLRPAHAVAAENLFLRKQLAMYQERGVEPRRPSAAERVSLVVLSRWFDWRDALVVVRPRTLARWHRAGFRLFWRYKSRPGRPPIPRELQALIRQMAVDNASWGEERIASELLLKLWRVHYNCGRPHMAIGPGIPEPPAHLPVYRGLDRYLIPIGLHVVSRAVLGGLHQEYGLQPEAA